MLFWCASERTSLNTGNYAAANPYKFSIPFQHGVAAELNAPTGVSLRKSDYGFWAGLSEKEAEKVSAWLAEQGTRVYLKDFFDCSIALAERSLGAQETEIGGLFSAAKYHSDNSARSEILSRLKQTWNSMKTLPNSGVISCPPPRKGKDFDLPTALAERLAKYTGLPFVTLGEWQGDKGQLKEIPATEKWSYLDSIGFKVNPRILTAAGHVLIVDDIYQSGTTINFLRSCLTESGIARSSSISIVKAARDTDDQ